MFQVRIVRRPGTVETGCGGAVFAHDDSSPTITSHGATEARRLFKTPYLRVSVARLTNYLTI